jgi:transcriptional regulator with XRE-family HTH domain
MKPRGKLTTGAKCREAREYLGASQGDLARAMRFGARGRDTVAEIERGARERGVPGPYQIALEAMLSGWRPWGVKFKIDKEATDG